MSVFYKLNPRKMERYLPYIKEAETQRHNESTTNAWMYGMYNARAIGACLSKNSRYPDKPEGLVERNDEGEPAYQITDADRFAGFAAQFNRSIKPKETATNDDTSPSLEITTNDTSPS